MGQRQGVDDEAEGARQGGGVEEGAAEEGHGEKDVGIDLAHFLEGIYLHGGDEADLGEDDAVQCQHQEKEGRDGEPCAEGEGEGADDGRGEERPEERRQELSDDEGIGPDGGAHVLLQALVIDPLRVDGRDAVEADIHGVQREDARHDEVKVRPAVQRDAAPQAPAEGHQIEERRHHAGDEELRQAALQHHPVPPKDRPDIK